MQTITFRCEKCGNMVTVAESLAGQSVQCPHCQQLVAAPGPAEVAPPTELAFAVPTAEEQESIFDAAVHPDDLLFSVASLVKIEMPPAPGDAPPTQLLAAEADIAQRASAEPASSWQVTQHAGEAPSQPPVHLHHAAPETPALPGTSDVMGDTSPPAEAGHAVAPDFGPESELALPSLAVPSLAARQAGRAGMGSGLFIPLVLIPLISYSILATIAVMILYLRPAPEDPFERLPDLEGDYTGAKHEKQGAILYERLKPDLELPNKLKVALGESIRVGDLAVHPERVELRRIKIRHVGSPTALSPYDCLVLHLLVQNTSRDVVFYPLDPYFERRWKDPSYGGKPYTFLEVGKRRLFGGPLVWKPGRPAQEEDTIEGQRFEPLHPGEKLTTFVCTDPEDRVDKVLREHQGPYLWRVQVRRGLVRVGERERSATAVVGVKFTHSDIQRSKG